MTLTLLQGDALEMLRTIEAETVQTCVTSPPYWGLRDYGAEGQLGLEKTPEEYVEKLVGVFREVRRVLRKDGTLWLNLGDCFSSGNSGMQRRDNKGGVWTSKKGEYNQPSAKANPGRKPIAGMKTKDLVGIPWMVAFALRADGWYLRSDIIWSKPNPMPESVRDRPTRAHEFIFLMAKSDRYFYDPDAIREPHAAKSLTHRGGGRAAGKAGVQDATGKIASGNFAEWKKPRVVDPRGRNSRSVWTVASHSYKDAHFATYPPKLIRPCILAGSRPGDIVLDPFNGAGTTGLVAQQLRRSYIGIDINPEYLALTRKRLAEVQVELFTKGSA